MNESLLHDLDEGEGLAIRSVSTQHALVHFLWSHVSVYFCLKCVFNFF